MNSNNNKLIFLSCTRVSQVYEVYPGLLGSQDLQ